MNFTCSSIKLNAEFVLLNFGFALTCIAGIVGNVTLVRKLRHVSVLPISSRILLGSMTCAALVFCTGTLLKTIIYHSMLAWFGFDAMALRPTACFALAGSETMSGTTLGLSIVSLGAERLFVFLKYNTDFEFESIVSCSRKIKKLSVVVATACWLMGIVTVIGQVLSVRGKSNELLCFCHVVLVFDYRVVLGLGVLYATLTVSTGLLYVSIYIVAQRKYESHGINTALYPLTQRFSLWQTLSVTKAMLPSVILDMICWGLAYSIAATIQQVYFSEMSIHGVNQLLVYVQLPVVLQAAVHPWLCMAANRHLKIRNWRYVYSGAQSPQCAERARYAALTPVPIVEFHMTPAEAQATIEHMWKAK